MYQFLLFIHSWLRWVVLLLGIFLVIRSYMGLSGTKPFTKGINGMSAGFMGLVHLQVVLGLLLYFIFSPIIETAMADMGNTMKNPALRFWAVEHITSMILAAVAVTVGRIKSKRALDEAGKYKALAIWFTIGMILILAGVPWKLVPLFRGF